MNFKNANRFPLGTEIECCYQCAIEVTWGGRNGVQEVQKLQPFESFELVHENHNGHVHWYKPGTEYFIPNVMLNPVEILEVRFGIQIGGEPHD